MSTWPRCRHQGRNLISNNPACRGSAPRFDRPTSLAALSPLFSRGTARLSRRRVDERTSVRHLEFGWLRLLHQ